MKETLETRGIVTEEYSKIAKELYQLGHKTEAKIISNLAKEVAEKSTVTKAQAAYDSGMSAFRQPEQVQQAETERER